MTFMKELEKQEESITENGAVGFKTTGSKLVDLNFAIPSFRDNIDIDLFDQAMSEDPKHTIKWLLYLRDVRQGVGERQSFRDFMVHMSNEHEKTVLGLLAYANIAEFGRWDDYIDLIFRTSSNKVKVAVEEILIVQFNKDMKDYLIGNTVSLLAKWLPSANASSKQTKERAKELIKVFRVTERTYRKTLSALRKHIDIVESKMSANQWDKIEYSHVPSKANLNYNKAFFKHDEERRLEFIESLEKGETKINANALFLHDIVNSYGRNHEVDRTLEQMWKAQKVLEGFENTLVVRDGSGSMTCGIDNKSNITALNVADAISIYCAENNSGEFHNKIITFSSKPKLLDISGKETLLSKLLYLKKENDCSNTDIEKVFNMILNVAKKSKLSQEYLPKSVLIISDLEFDAVATDAWGERTPQIDDKLFEVLADRYKKLGYTLPKLVFWNVNSRTNTIPITENDNGVTLISGFSKNLMKMVMSNKMSPYDALIEELDGERYSVVDKMFE